MPQKNMTVENKRQWNNLLAKARRGNSDAQWEVGYYYEEGIMSDSGATIVEPKPERALHWHTLSAEKGNDSGQLALGCLLSTGDGVKRDIKAAIYWTKQALNQGVSAAAHNLGTIYRDMKKPRLAFHWYNRAVEMGDLDSLLQVGLCYLFGFGTNQDYEVAYNSFQQIINDESSYSCERTEEDALYWMGIMHLIGIGSVKKSIRKARRLLETANKDCDHEQANELLNLIGKTKYILA
jgi:TPR repeat protein